MKQFYYTLLLLYIPIICFGQSYKSDWYVERIDNGNNFKKIIKSTREKCITDSFKINKVKSFYRWENFWSDRITIDDDTSTSYSYMRDAINNFRQKTKSTTSIYANWISKGPSNLSIQYIGIVSAIYVPDNPPNYDTMYIGTNASGLWRTVNGGQNWVNLTDNIGSPILGVVDIVANPNNHREMYISAAITTFEQNNGFGILKTTDGGINWNYSFQFSANSSLVCNKIIIDPVNTNIVYAIINKKLYRSIDSGDNWDIIFQGPWTDNKCLRDIEILPDNNNTVIISTDGYITYDDDDNPFYHSAEIWKTTNAELTTPTWTQLNLTQDYIDNIAIATSSFMPKSFIIAYRDMNGIKIYKNKNTSNSLTYQYYIQWGGHPNTNDSYSGFDYWCSEFAISATDSNVMYVGGYYMCKLYNNFQSISKLLSTHVDIRCLTMLKTPSQVGNEDVFFVGHDGGVSKFVGISHSNLNGDLAITQFYGLSNSEIANSTYVAGTQDNNTYVFQNTYTKIAAGDCGDFTHNKNDSLYVYGSGFGIYPYFSLVDLSSPSLHYHAINNDAFANSVWSENSVCGITRPIELDKNNTLYVGHHNVFKYTGDLTKHLELANHNTINYWDKISDFSQVNSHDALRVVKIANSNTDCIYAAFKNPTWGSDTDPDKYKKKLWKTSDGGTNWNTIEVEPVRFAGITDIAINPDNENVFWVSFGGFWKDSFGDAINRVWYFDGTNWSDISNGLEPFPVNKIKYIEGSNNNLLAATDVGVYYYNDYNSTWLPLNDGMPYCIISDIEINYSTNKIRAATFGRGIWEGYLPCTSGPYDFVINSNTTWNDYKREDRNIIVESGNTLTVTGKLVMTEGRKIIVKTNAKLIIDGGTITNACNSPWQGIEVQGNSAQSQYPISGAYQQGIVQIINGGTIENAVCGIKTINSDASNPSLTTGGIIRADNAVFHNCKTAIEFLPYQNYQPANNNMPIANFSLISQCTFETDDNLYAQGVEPTAFISLAGVQGIKIYGNTFTNTTTQNVNNRGIGVLSTFSGFDLLPVCTSQTYPCPEVNKQKNTFNGLSFGVGASSSFLPINIDNNEFENNYGGVFLCGISNAKIINNNFNVGYCGLLLYESTAYRVEENTFGSDGNTVNYGIGISNSGQHPNLIYKNKFEGGLSFSCHAEYTNNGPLIYPDPMGLANQGYMGPGLVFKCNEYGGANQVCDIEITSGGIGGNQGYCYDAGTPAGNIFNSTGNSLGNIAVSSGVAPFSYYHHSDANAIPVVNQPYTPVVTLHNCGITMTTGSCPSNSSNCNPSCLIDNITLYANVLKPLNNQIIKGNNQDLLNRVMTANTSGGLSFATLRDTLLNVSPYLSDTILIAAIEKYDTIEPVMLKDVMVANSPLTYKVKTALNKKALPLSIRQAIDLAQNGTSARAELEAKISDTAMLMGLAENELVRQYMNDTTIAGIDSVISYFLTKTDDLSRKILVQAYFTKGDSANLIPALDSLRLQTYEDTLFKEFFTLMADFCTNKTLLYEMDTVQEQTIRDIAASNTEAAVHAQTVLAMVYNEIPSIELEKLNIPDSLSIHGFLKSDSLCNGLPAAGDTLVLLDADTNSIVFITPVITDSTGYFVFYLPELLKLSDTALYGFGDTDGTPVKNFELKTISQWVAASPLNLTLRKTEADFIFDTIRCYAGSVHFTSIVTGGKKPYTYLWDFGNDSVATSPYPAMLYDTTGAYDVTLTVSSADGCTDTVNKTVIVNPLPAAAITPTSAAICIGDSATLTASGGISYLWNTSDTSAVISVAPDATTAYTVAVTSAEGCSNTASITITVNPLPTAEISSSDSTICAGDSVTLTASGGATYLWNTADTAAAIIVVPDSTTTYTVTVTDSEGCNASNTVTVTSICASITGRTMYAGKANPGTAPNPPTYNSRIYDINKEIVILKNQSGAEIARDTSDADGAFYFANVYNGNYTLAYDKYTADTMQWCNDVNAVDAVYIMYYITNDTATDPSRNFSRIYKKAADVDNNGTVNSVDKAKIQAKIGNPYNTTYNFPKGNWVNLDTTITVNGADVNLTIPVISYGDYNSSSSKYKDSANTWSQVKAFKDENVIFISDESIIINNSGLIEIPLRISSSLNDFSAMGLELYYPKEKYKLESASMPNTVDSNGVFKINPTLQEIIDHNDDLLVTDDSGIIRVVFATTNFFDVENNDILIYLGFRPLYELEPGELDFKMFGTGIITDQYGTEAKANEYLLVPKIFVQGTHIEAGFDFTGYPNPFNHATTLTYNLPENGMVKLSVYNSLGVCVSELINETQLSGKHTFVFSPKNQPAGMYTFRLDFTGEQDSNCAVLKMIYFKE